jgi:hypothetical protein
MSIPYVVVASSYLPIIESCIILTQVALKENRGKKEGSDFDLIPRTWLAKET